MTQPLFSQCCGAVGTSPSHHPTCTFAGAGKLAITTPIREARRWLADMDATYTDEAVSQSSSAARIDLSIAIRHVRALLNAIDLASIGVLVA